MVELDVERVRTLAAARGLDLTGLAREARLSRQGLHRLLRQEAGVLSRGLESLATALGVDALALLRSPPRAESAWDRLGPSLALAAQGSARAFEELPALLRSSAAPREPPTDLQPTERQLLAAAGEVARALWPRRWLPGFIERHAARIPSSQVFVFGLEMTSLERLAARTPEPMRRQRVFGDFALEDFARHAGGSDR